MRKLISLLVAVVLVMSLATVAFADGETTTEWDGTYTPVAAGTKFEEITKTYDNENNVVV